MKTQYKSLIVVLVLMVVPSMTFSADRKAANADASKLKPAATAVQQRVVAPDERPNLTQASTPAVNPVAGEQIRWQVISSGGARGTSTNYVLNGTVGQTAVGRGNSTTYGVNHGYWQNFGGCCIGNRGNANGDLQDKVNVSDVTYLLAYLFGIPSGPPPPCQEEANANGDSQEKVNVSDVTYLLSYLFGIPSGPPPPACP